MCFPIAVIGAVVSAVSAAATVAGSMISSRNQANVANAQMQAAAQTQRAQDTAFFQRNAAQSDQNLRDAATQAAAMQSEQQAQQQLEASQNQARADREAQINQANAQTQNIGQQAQQLVANTESQTNAQSLAAAQSQQQAQIAALASPGTANIASGTANTPSGPVAAPAQTNNETASAIATRLAQAAAATRQYTANQAAVASYGAPISALNTATTNLGTASAPLVSAQKQVESGLPTYLMPSSINYQNAGNYYQNLLNAIQTRTQGRLNVSSAIANGSITNADLAQADTATNAQNQAAIAAWQAASDPVPGIVGGIGQLGLYAGGRMGANSVIGNIFSGTPAQQTGGPFDQTEFQQIVSS